MDPSIGKVLAPPCPSLRKVTAIEKEVLGEPTQTHITYAHITQNTYAHEKMAKKIC